MKRAVPRHSVPAVLLQDCMDDGLPSFVIRLWHEDDSVGDETAWRGHVINVMSGEGQYVHDIAGIAGFLEAQLQRLSFESCSSSKSGISSRRPQP